MTSAAQNVASQLLAELRRRSETLAVAESLTGGRLAAELTAVPGASTVFRGGVVAYATDLKAALLGVDERLLADVGAVSPEVALQMARGVRGRLAATYGLATTGVAGPDPQDGRSPGEVYVGIAGPGQVDVLALHLSGDRAQICAETVAHALRALGTVLGPGLPQDR